MFEALTNQFEDAVKAFKGEAKISDENVDEALKQVRRALLEADVSLSVVKEFIEEVRSKAIGTEVVRGINPGQKFIQVVHPLDATDRSNSWKSSIQCYCA